MFRRLTDFGHTRSWVEALGFYLVYGILGIIAIAALAAVIGLFTGDFGLQEGLTFGTVAAPVLPLVLSFLILRAKGLLRNVWYIAIGLLSGVTALAGGLFLGLIFVAFLTTRRPVTAEQVAHA